MREDEVYCVKMDDQLAEMVEIRRFGEVEGGFQRKLRDARLKQIIKRAKMGEAIPPIVLAKIDGKYRLLDGQHRFFAWKEEKFDLFAQVNPMRPIKAVESFCTINGTSVKVGLSHQLKVDPHPHAQKVRAMALEFGLENNLIHRLAVILSQGNVTSQNRQPEVDKDQWQTIRSFLDIWRDDKRWDNVTARSHYYRSGGVILAVFMVCKKAKAMEKVLPILKKLDFSKNGSIGLRYGVSNEAIKKLKSYAMEALIKRGFLGEQMADAA